MPVTATPTVPDVGTLESVRYGVAAPSPQRTREAPGLLRMTLFGISSNPA